MVDVTRRKQQWSSPRSFAGRMARSLAVGFPFVPFPERPESGRPKTYRTDERSRTDFPLCLTVHGSVESKKLEMWVCQTWSVTCRFGNSELLAQLFNYARVYSSQAPPGASAFREERTALPHRNQIVAQGDSFAGCPTTIPASSVRLAQRFLPPCPGG
jgi:hypothetical protein